MSAPGDAGGAVPVLANTVLPAERRPVVLDTSDGLRLVGELALPVGRPATATVVCLHPLPRAGGGGDPGGSMDSHVLRKAAKRLPAMAGVAVLRFNTRGTTSPEGTSEGAYGGLEAEGPDLAAALDLVEAEDLPRPWLVGWSFGSEVVLRWGVRDPTPLGGVLLSPPLHRATDDDLDAWAHDGRPLLALVPEHDDYLRPPEARQRFARVPQAEVVGVDGAKHLWVGYAEEVLDLVVRRVQPAAYPLPSAWVPGDPGGQAGRP